MNVTPSQFDALWKLMDAADLRHQIVSNNVANVNTPQYVAQAVAFEDQLANGISGLDADQLSRLEARIIDAEGLTSRADGNNVDIDKEMGKLNKNSLLYQTYTQVLASKLAMMRTAITGQ